MDESKTQPLHNFSSLQSEFFRKNSLLPINKKHIMRKKIDGENTFSHQKYTTPQPIQDIVQQIRMKDKFDELYQRIQKISSKEQFIKNRALYRKMFLEESPNKKSNILNMFEGVTVDSQKSKNYKSKSIVNYKSQKSDNKSLEVNTILSEPLTDERQPNFKMILRKTRYKTKLDPIKKIDDKLSNNLRDYLHVGKITMTELQQTLTTTKSKQLQQRLQEKLQHLNCTQSNLLNLKIYMPDKQSLPSPVLRKNFSNNENTVVKRKFKPPFETYYYLDFIWKVQLSNRLFIKFPAQYETKFKIYIGRGNNYRLVQSILKRRPWFVVTDKIQQANFVWTQIKSGYYMSLQKKPNVAIEKKQIEYLQKGILTKDQTQYYKNYFKIHSNGESKIKQNMVFRNKTLNIESISISDLQPLKIHNHFKNNFIIGNKKALFHTMSIYYSINNEEIFDYLPLTFHIKNGLEDDEYLIFLKHYYSEAKKIKKDPSNKSCNAWIVKPGENTNRGNGIIMCLTLQQIKTILKTKQKHADGTYKTYIVQRYIQRPLLYKKRKFDLRHYMMISCLNGHVKGYWSRIGYVRTTSSEYTLKFNSGSIHLTNDAVQKQLPDYGKFQKGNKISYEQLQTYLQKCNYKVNFWQSIYPKMKKIATDSIRACASNLDPDHKRNFEIFGLDFMIDESFNVWLIEINTNPCLQLSCPLLSRIIPKMLHDTFQINIDSIFTPATSFRPKNDIFLRNSNQQNSYQLVFDERQENLKLTEDNAQLIIDSKLQQEEQDIFDDDGEDLED